MFHHQSDSLRFAWIGSHCWWSYWQHFFGNHSHSLGGGGGRRSSLVFHDGDCKSVLHLGDVSHPPPQVQDVCRHGRHLADAAERH